MRLALALALLASPACGEVAFDPGIADSCRARGLEEQSAAPDCFGNAAQVCMEMEGSDATPVMGACLEAEWKFWDSTLNIAYKTLKTLEKANPEALDALTDMQRAWLPFRDARCDYEAAQWSGGTGLGPALTACLLEETARQAMTLELAIHQFKNR